MPQKLAMETRRVYRVLTVGNDTDVSVIRVVWAD